MLYLRLLLGGFGLYFLWRGFVGLRGGDGAVDFGWVPAFVLLLGYLPIPYKKRLKTELPPCMHLPSLSGN
jgi:hypothetical protein